MTEDSALLTKSPEAIARRGKVNLLWFAIKAAISLGLIAFIFWKLDFAAVWARLKQLSLALILTVVLMFVVQTCIGAWRWWVIIGAFFNQLLPSSIGGDVARAWYVYRKGYGKGISVVTVLSDRIYGMLLLVCLATLFFPILVYYSVSDQALIMVAVLIAVALSALTAAFWLDCLPASLQRWALIRRLGFLSEATRAVTADRRAILLVIGLSFLVHLITILATLLLLATIAPQHKLLLCAALVPMITLIAMVPISIAGWGVRESIMIYGLGLANVPTEAALIVSILVGLSLATVGLLGGVTWLTENDRAKSRESTG
jgi:glycosyltransferase 2 family protein